MKEHPDFRDELEEIFRFFGGKHLLTISDVSEYTGKCRKWCREHYRFDNGNISAVSLAKELHRK